MIAGMEHTAYQETAGILAEQLREAVVDHQAFDQKVKACELEKCRATCCHDGVYLSQEEAMGIQSMLEQHAVKLTEYGLSLPVEPILEVRTARGRKVLKTATREAEVGELADDYPEHFPKTRCVFLDRQGRCGIQRLAMEQGAEPWFNKPLTCWIHPIVVMPVSRERTRPLLTLVSPENDPQKSEGYPGFASCTHCGRPDESGKKARQVLSAELEMLGRISGRDILGELNAEEVSRDGGL